LKVDKEQKSAAQWLITVEVAFDTIDGEVEAELKKLQGQSSMPGFRKGKVPHSIIRKQFEKEVRIDLLQKHLGDFYEEALKEAEIGTPVAAPRIDIVQFESDKPLVFTALVDTEPPIELASWESLTVVHETAEVTDQVIDAELENLRERHAIVQEDTDPAGPKSLLEVELQEMDAGYIPIIGRKRENVTIDLNRSTTEIREALIGIKPGENRNVTLLRPPASPDEERKQDYLLVSAKSVKKKELPELNDEFARSVGPELQDLPALKEAIKIELLRQIESISYQRMVHLLAHQMVDSTPVEVPDSMMEDYLDRLVDDARKKAQESKDTHFDETFVRDRFKERAGWNLKWYLIRKRIAERDGLKVEAEDIQTEIERIAAATGKKLKLVEAFYSTEKERNRLEDDLLERKVLQFIVGKARVIDRSVTFEDFFSREETAHQH
jgi:trigger factor